MGNTVDDPSMGIMLRPCLSASGCASESVDALPACVLSLSRAECLLQAVQANVSVNRAVGVNRAQRETGAAAPRRWPEEVSMLKGNRMNAISAGNPGLRIEVSRYPESAVVV